MRDHALSILFGAACAIVVSSAVAQDRLTGVPIVVRREILAEAKKRSVSPVPLNEKDVDSVREQLALARARWLVGHDDLVFSESLIDGPSFREPSLQASPYIDASRETLKSVRSKGHQVYFILEDGTALNENQTKRFVDAWKTVDVAALHESFGTQDRKGWSPDVQEIRQYTTVNFPQVLGPLISRKAIVDLATKLAGKVGEKIVVDKIAETITPEFLQTEDAKLARAFMGEIQQYMKEHGAGINELGRGVKDLKVLGEAAALNTYATFIVQEKLFAYTVDAMERITSDIKLIQDDVIKLETSLTQELSKVRESLDQQKKQIAHGGVIAAEALRQTQENSGKLDLLAGGVYDILPTPRARLEFLDNPAFNVTPEFRDSERTRQLGLKLASEVDGYCDVANEIVGALATLGADADTIEVANTVVAKASKANEIFKSIVNGDVFGTIGGVLGLIFGGGPDIEELRHDEVMNALKAIQENQQKIYSKLFDLEYELSQLRNVIAELQVAVRCVDLKVVDVYRLNREVLNKPIDDLIALLNQIERGTHKEFNIPGNSKAFNDGFNSLRTRFDRSASTRDLPELYRLSAAMAEGNDVGDYIRSFARPHIELVKQLRWDESKLAQLSGPAMSCDRLENEPLSGNGRFCEELFYGDVLDAVAIERDVDTLVRCVPFRFLQDSEGDLFDFEGGTAAKAFVNAREVNSECRDLLKNGLAILDASLAQQVVFAGDIVLLDIYSNPNKPEFLALLQMNPVLAHNLAIFCMYRSRLSEFEYRTYLKCYDPAVWSTVMEVWKQPVRFARPDVTNGWLLLVGGPMERPEVRINLPTNEQFASRRFIVPQSVERLRRLRGRVISLLADLELASSQDDRGSAVVQAVLDHEARERSLHSFVVHE